MDDALVVWVITGSAQEASIINGPLIDVTFKTATSSPWKLLSKNATSEHIAEMIQFEEISNQTCIYHGVAHYCQEWVVSFYSERECHEGGREINVDFWSKYREDLRPISMSIVLSGSSAFECAQDLGSFELTSE